MDPARSWRTWGPWAAAAVLVLGSTVSCDRSAARGASATEPSGSPGAFATATTTGRTPVFGSTTCSVTSRSSETRGDREIVHEHFSCLDEMSDPRVSGSDEIDVATVFAVRGDIRAAPWTAELMVSNEGGTWRGTCTGALEFTTDPLGLPRNYGICTLAGEGGYTDLSYAYLLAGRNEELRYAGWIESAR